MEKIEGKIVYVAGPITGIENYKENFAKAEEELKAQGYVVLNPAILPDGMTWQQYMDICIPMVDVADAVYFLPGWENSKGAMQEYNRANYQGKGIYYQKGAK